MAATTNDNAPLREPAAASSLVIRSGAAPASRLGRDTILALGLRGTARLLSLLLGTTLTRLLGVADYGLVNWALTWQALLLLPGTLSLEFLLVKDVAANAELGQWGRLKGLVSWSVRTTIIRSGLLAAVGVGVGFIFLRDEPRTLAALCWALAAVPALCVANLLASVLLGLHRPIRSQVPGELLQPLAIVALAWLFCTCTDSELHVHATFAALSLSHLLLLTLLAALAWRARPAALRGAPTAECRRAWWDAAWPLLLLTVLQSLAAKGPILLVAELQSKEQSGMFSVACRLAELVLLPSFAVTPLLYARCASLFAAGDLAGLERLARSSARWVFALTIPAALAIVVFGEWLLGLFGTPFRSQYSTLLMLACAQAASVLAGGTTMLLQMTNQARLASLALLATTSISLLLGAALIPHFGGQGAAAAAAAGMLVGAGLLCAVTRIRLRINPAVVGRFMQDAPTRHHAARKS